MIYFEEHLGPKGALRAMFDGRPQLDLDGAQRALDANGLGRAVAVEPLGPYVINSIHRVMRDGSPPVVLKGQYRPLSTDSLAGEATTLRLLAEATRLPVPQVLALDEAGEVLGYPFLLLSWLDGEPSKELYDEGDRARRCHLARQLGEIVAAVHACPVPAGVSLPAYDLRRWPELIEADLFAGDGLHEALRRLAPDLEPAVRDGTAAARRIDDIGEPLLSWRDASLHNTVAATGADGGRICGVFDFQGARRSQPHLDLVMPYARLAGRAWTPGDEPPREWVAFCEGYGEPVDLAGPQAGASACANPAWQVRHWWDILGHLHRRTPDWLDSLLEGLARLR